VKGKRCCKGFTLIELVVTLSIIAVLSCIVVPFSFGAVMKNELKTAARMIASDIRYGENKALTEQYSSYKITFVPTSNEYRKYFDKKNINNYERVEMPPRIKMSSAVFGTEQKLYFNSKGSVLVGGSVTLTDGRGNWAFVRVTPVTGRVRIEYTEE
jgi:prepilin-type N-terminal cleavage/methylation domain-containing protein